jgi:hypothetical protein
LEQLEILSREGGWILTDSCEKTILSNIQGYKRGLIDQIELDAENHKLALALRKRYKTALQRSWFQFLEVCRRNPNGTTIFTSYLMECP